MKFKNTYTRLERFCNAVSSRKRIEILNILLEKPDLSLGDIARKIDAEKQNASLHTYKLLHQGLIAKRKNKTKVEHAITKRGELVLSFVKEVDRRI